MDIQRFIADALRPREAAVDVPELAEWFPDGPPRWIVRGLTAAEFVHTREGNGDALRTLVTALAGDGDKAAAIRAALGVSGDQVPADVSRRIEALAIASVSPALGENNRDVAVKLAETFPIVFMKVTNVIDGLTVQGAEPGKLKRSGEIPA